MKRILLLIALVATLATGVNAEKLVILHTNDTHSTIDPDSKTDLGGILRRKAAIDSIRAAEPNVMLIDAGDAVQGSLFFMLFGGEVETKAMNTLGYDLGILGNHEFDNGMEALAQRLEQLDAEMISSNYNLDATPLAPYFLPYATRSFGGKKIAFIGINVDPEALIDEDKTQGLVYTDGIAEANRLAKLLKSKEGADIVVAVTHIGYTSSKESEPQLDPNLARLSTDIDLIIGGHSHTVIAPGSPESMIPNANGCIVLIAQTGEKGANLGKVTIDLDSKHITSELIPIDSRYDDRIDPAFAAQLDMYREKVDSIAAIKIGASAIAMERKGPELLNWASDMVKQCAAENFGIAPDFAIMNQGGLRASMEAGDVTMGTIMDIFPFDNKLVIVELTGAEALALMDDIAARGGNGISAGAEVVMDKEKGVAKSFTLNGKPIDPKATYRVATIDYLANGNDHMVTFKGKRVVAKLDEPIFKTYIRYISSLKAPINSTSEARMHY